MKEYSKYLLRFLSLRNLKIKIVCFMITYRFFWWRKSWLQINAIKIKIISGTFPTIFAQPRFVYILTDNLSRKENQDSTKVWHFNQSLKKEPVIQITEHIHDSIIKKCLIRIVWKQRRRRVFCPVRIQESIKNKFRVEIFKKCRNR